MERSELPELKPGMEVEGLEVEALVGRGAFGAVYRARAPTGEQYALKFVSLERAGPWARREALILLQLNHPNLVRAVGHGPWPFGEPRYLCLKMAYVRGPSLGEWVRERRASARQVVGRVLGVARGLAVAHEAGVLHRDVKEGNVLVREEDGEAVLVDFGVGSYEGAVPVTQGLLPPCTPGYRSPEALQFAQEHAREEGAHYRAGRADDMYALGVTLYRLLTERYPFDPERAGYLQAVVEEAPLPPHLVNPRVPRELSELCLRLLAKRPEERPSAVALCAELEALQERGSAPWQVPLSPGALVQRAAGAGQQASRPERRTRPAGGAVGRGGAALEPATAVATTEEHLLLTRAVRAGWYALGVTVALGVGLALGLGVERLGTGREAPGLSAGPVYNRALEALPRQEVALERALPEAGRAAAPPKVESTSAVAASRVAPYKDQGQVNTDKKPGRRVDKRGIEGLGRLGKAIGVTAACTYLTACPGAQVRPRPPPESCPPEAVQSMERLGLFGWPSRLRGSLVDDLDSRVVPVREGEVDVLVPRNWHKLPYDTRLVGTVAFGEGRVWGWLTKARLPGGQHVPVCVELLNDEDSTRGLLMEPGTTSESAQVFSTVGLRAVRSFK